MFFSVENDIYYIYIFKKIFFFAKKMYSMGEIIPYTCGNEDKDSYAFWFFAMQSKNGPLVVTALKKAKWGSFFISPKQYYSNCFLQGTLVRKTCIIKILPFSLTFLCF